MPATKSRQPTNKSWRCSTRRRAAKLSGGDYKEIDEEKLFMSELNSLLPAWKAVAAHAREMATVHLRDLAGSDSKRWQQLHLEYDSWLLDISRQRITQQTLSLLLELSRAVDLPGRIAAMF